MTAVNFLEFVVVFGTLHDRKIDTAYFKSQNFGYMLNVLGKMA